MNLVKKLVAGLLAASMLMGLTSCGKDTSWTYKLDDENVITSGMYVGLSMNAYQAASSVEGFDATKTPFKQKLEDKNGLQWVIDKADSLAKQYLAVASKFKEMGLSFTEEEQKSIDAQAASYWSYSEKNYAPQGCGQESFTALFTNDSKKSKIFDALYNKGGSQEVSEKDLRAAFEKDYAKVYYIPVNTADADNKPVEQSKIDADAEMLIKRLKAGDSFETVLEEYFSTAETKPSVDQYTAMITSDDTQVPEAIRKFAFDKKVGDVEKVTDGQSTFIMKKLDLNEVSTDFDNYRIQILSKMKMEELNTQIEKWASELTITRNEAAIKKHNPKHIKIAPTATASAPIAEPSGESATDSSSK